MQNRSLIEKQLEHACMYIDSQRLKSTNVLHANAYMHIHTYNHVLLLRSLITPL